MSVVTLAGDSALHEACRCEGNEEAKGIRDDLIRRGACVHALNSHGDSPLDLVARWGEAGEKERERLQVFRDFNSI